MYPRRFQPAWLWGLLPAIAAITYPYALKYAQLSLATDALPQLMRHAFSWLGLLWAISVPVVGLYFARSLSGHTQMRRIAYATVVVPALYVVLGELQRIFHSPVSDELVWWTLWVILGAMAVSASQDSLPPFAERATQRWRAVHAVTAALITLFVIVHLFAQSMSLFGEDTYTRVQQIVATAYRTPVIEAILVGLMISQIISGVKIAWHWGPLQTDTARVMQVAGGTFLALFILGHMISIFLYARTMHQIPTDWSYATGAPHGLLHDAWNIRLIPHYSWGVFFVISHIASGIRWVLLQRGMDSTRVQRGWYVAHALAVVLSLAIITGLVLPSIG